MRVIFVALVMLTPGPNSEKSTLVLSCIAKTEMKFKNAPPWPPKYSPGISKLPALNSVPRAAFPLLTNAAAWYPGLIPSLAHEKSLAEA